MRKKVFILFTAFIFILNAFAVSFADTKKSKKVKVKSTQTNQLLASLPSSDAVVTIDMARLMNDAAPQILAAKPEFLNKINAHIDELRGKTGIDLRLFEQIAIGAAYTGGTETDFEPVILARGKFNSGAFLGIAKLAAKGKYREEKVGDKTIYIFQTAEIMQSNKPQTANTQTNGIIDRMTKSLATEIALTGFNDNTLAIGSLARVKDTIGNKPRLSADLMALANRKPTAIVSFGANTPVGISQFIKLDIDEVGENLDAIRQLYGTFDYAGGNAVFSATTKSVDANKAQELEEMLAGLQMIGKGLLAGASGNDKKVYANLVEKAVISRKTNEVMLDLQIPKTDVDALVGILIK